MRFWVFLVLAGAVPGLFESLYSHEPSSQEPVDPSSCSSSVSRLSPKFELESVLNKIKRETLFEASWAASPQTVWDMLLARNPSLNSLSPEERQLFLETLESRQKHWAQKAWNQLNDRQLLQSCQYGRDCSPLFQSLEYLSFRVESQTDLEFGVKILELLEGWNDSLLYRISSSFGRFFPNIYRSLLDQFPKEQTEVLNDRLNRLSSRILQVVVSKRNFSSLRRSDPIEELLGVSSQIFLPPFHHHQAERSLNVFLSENPPQPDRGHVLLAHHVLRSSFEADRHGHQAAMKVAHFAFSYLNAVQQKKISQELQEPQRQESIEELGYYDGEEWQDTRPALLSDQDLSLQAFSLALDGQVDELYWLLLENVRPPQEIKDSNGLSLAESLSRSVDDQSPSGSLFSALHRRNPDEANEMQRMILGFPTGGL